MTRQELVQLGEVEEIARRLGAQVRSGLVLDGFGKKVLPLAVRLQRLRRQGFTGQVTILFSDGEARSVVESANLKISDIELQDGIAS